MSPALTEKFEIFIYSQKNSNPVDIPRVYPLVANATLLMELEPEDLILPVADDPVDFIIELGNECEDLQYIADTTNEAYGTTYTEDDVQRIINDFIEAITAE